jgi:hypothetical protein
MNLQDDSDVDKVVEETVLIIIAGQTESIRDVYDDEYT